MLDDPGLMAKQDREGMLKAAWDYPSQWREACSLPLPDLSGLPGDPDQVLFTGMGGSGTGGEFAVGLMDTYGGPVGRVVHDYDIPGWVDEATLVAATSYSGGTEETLTGVMRAVEQKAPWFAISTGGLLSEAARRQQAPWVKVPGGYQPRAAFGYLTVALLRVLSELGLLQKDRITKSLRVVQDGLEKVREECGPEVPLERNPAKRLAEALAARPVVVVADAPWAPLAERVRCQLNENAKAMAFTRILPEANHNDMVAWSRAPRVDEWSVLFLGPFDRSESVRERAAFLREQLEARRVPVHDLDEPVEDPIARMFLSEYRATWVSLYLGYKHGVDPGEVDVIHALKKRVGETGHMDRVRKELDL